VQEGVRRSTSTHGVVKLGGTAEGTADTLITESAIRALYRHSRDVMGL
jgi:anthranilate 1,2-dioxygenase large subunit